MYLKGGSTGTFEEAVRHEGGAEGTALRAAVLHER